MQDLTPPRSFTVESDAKQISLDWLAAHGDLLYSYALQRVGSPELAEELVQETFLGAICNIQQYSGASSPQTWLVGILRNKLADHYRRKARNPSLAHATQTLQGFQTSGVEPEDSYRNEKIEWLDPATSIFEAEFQSVLRSCIGQLPDLIRQAFEFRFFDQLEQEEVCQLQGISRNNLAARMYRARKYLRECLTRHWL